MSLAVRFFCITRGTRDYGDKYVVREWRGSVAAVVPLAVADSLEEARGAVEEYTPSLCRVERREWDDLVIVESWASAEDARVMDRIAEALESGAFL